MKAEYSLFLRESHLLAQLIVGLFRLLPSSPVITHKEAMAVGSPSYKLAFSGMFNEAPSLSMSTCYTVEELQHVACAAYYR